MLGHDRRDLAETYERASDFQLEIGVRLVERMGISAGARILDVGCGTGRLTRWIASHASVVGIDPLAERIAIARSHGSAARFEVGRAEDLGAFEEASFDAVCMSSVFHWVSDKARALAEIRRVLRPGGTLGLTTMPQELSGAGTIARVLRPILRRAPYAGHVDVSALAAGERCTSTDLVMLILESGLELVELHVTQQVIEHESGAAFVDFAEASSFGNLLRIVPEPLRPQLRAELVAAFDGVTIRGWGVLLLARKS